MPTYEDDYQLSIEDPVAFWQQRQSEIEWFETPTKTLDQDANGSWRWYVDGSLNSCWLALDRHIEAGRGDATALIYDSPATQSIASYTFNELSARVKKVAGAMREAGVSKGDRVIIYLPMIPEAVIAMLACARLGAVHSVVFGGFAPRELAMRIDDAEPKLILTASCGIEFDKVIPYKPLVDAALELATHKVDGVVVKQRPQCEATLRAENEFDWSAWEAAGPSAEVVAVSALDPLYILYTSGTTGRPKGVVRDNGGHAVALTYSMHAVYGVNAGDVFWAASDVGWVVGHSYIVYGPLFKGCTTILFEGKPVRTPDAGTFWRVLANHRVKTFFVAPTAFRAIKKEDPECDLLAKYDLSSLEYLFVAGERCDAPTWHWLDDHLDVPVIDHWWQTETGWSICANMVGYGLKPQKVGSLTLPVPGYDVKILTDDGDEAKPNEDGNVVVAQPLPPGALPTIWRDHDRFIESYWSAFPGYYTTGDGGYRDEDGYVYVMGRTDDVMNVAGHRLSTGQIEEAIAAHPAVAECAVVGVRDSEKGQVPLGLVLLKDGMNIQAAALQDELVQLVRQKVGPFTNFKRSVVVKRLPKTRSGKILRQVMRKMADGDEYVIPSTIDDPDILDEIRAALTDAEISRGTA
ncbi:MAG: propionyl-CoA synthetase [Gammaproteobacteria bacterium]|nr:propionyl-CoA synthetase [Gammaproteobacteria bacterium]